MKLVCYSHGAERRVGFLSGEQVCDLNLAVQATGVQLPPFADLRALANVEHLAALRNVTAALSGKTEPAWAHPLDQVTLHAPFRPAQNIILAGGNTRDESFALRMRGAKPMLRYHTKAPSAVTDPGRPLSWPRKLTTQVHAEPHLAVVMGAHTSFVAPAAASNHVFGYSVATNVNSFDLKRKHGQWDKAVSLDTFLPWGPVVVTTDEVVLSDLTCRLWLNGRMALSGGAEAGLLRTAEVISEISFGMTLKPGDVLLTATAEGVGHGELPERWLQDGDIVRSGIVGICEIENTVVTY